MSSLPCRFVREWAGLADGGRWQLSLHQLRDHRRDPLLEPRRLVGGEMALGDGLVEALVRATDQRVRHHLGIDAVIAGHRRDGAAWQL